jgi:putative ABC transport system substrate-binding protein
VRRRKFIALLGGAGIALPLAARAQQSAMPLVGFLNPQSPERFAEPPRALREGLKDAGYVESENLAIDYRWGDNQVGRLPALAAHLVRQRVAVIVATGGAMSARAAKVATNTIPVAFNIVEDPVSLGLVASLARPGGNMTGVSMLGAELSAKRLELLRELVPGTARVAVLMNPDNPATDATLKELEGAARALGLQIRVLRASTGREIDAAFATFVRERPDALFVTGEPYFNTRRVQLILLAAFHRIPTTYALRDYAEVGGLMSYGASLRDAYRQVGIYAGRILKGQKPDDLPVVQLSKFELVINNQTARMLSITVPPALLASADELIE